MTFSLIKKPFPEYCRKRLFSFDGNSTGQDGGTCFIVVDRHSDVLRPGDCHGAGLSGFRRFRAFAGQAGFADQADDQLGLRLTAAAGKHISQAADLAAALHQGIAKLAFIPVRPAAAQVDGNGDVLVIQPVEAQA